MLAMDMSSSPSAVRRERAVPARATVYTARILKGAGLTAYAREILREWDETLGVEENLGRFRRSGAFGRSSERRANDILRVLSARYLGDADVRRGLGALARGRVDPMTIDLLLGYHAAQADRLLFDFAADFIYETYRRGVVEVGLDAALRFLEERGLTGGERGAWSVGTGTEIARKLLTAWRDFGLLRGASTKRIVAPHVPPLVAAWIATDRHRVVRATRSLLEDRAFRLVLLDADGVERALRAASDAGLLYFQGGGAVAHVTPKFQSLEELAHAVV